MKLVNVKKLSESLNIKESTLYAWAEQCKIPSLKIHGLLRFDIDEIDEWLKECRVKNKPEIQIKKHPHSDVSICNITKKAIADTKKKEYNSLCKGKPDQSSPERRG